MSIIAAIITLLVTAGVYVGTTLLNRRYNRSEGRDPVKPLYTLSQWNPSKWRATGECVIPTAPQTCIIEGMTGAYQSATHWCDLHEAGASCIDPDTGENVQNNPIPTTIACARIPFCGWSQCKLTFSGDGLFVRVKSSGDSRFTFENTSTDPTLFYMERLSVSQKTGLSLDQNGTIARFFFILEGDSTVYSLAYVNNVPADRGAIVSALTVVQKDASSSQLTMFMLMEAMPTTITPHAGPAPGDVVSAKILIFGGANRTQDPSVDVIAEFNSHVRQTLWLAAQKHDLVMISWSATSQRFESNPAEDSYYRILINWRSDTRYQIRQDAVESRLASFGSTNRAFYTWTG